jgi:hypothetical protein
MKPQRISGLALALACSSFLLAQIPSTGTTTKDPVPPPPTQEKPIDHPSTVQGGAIAPAPATAPKPAPVVIPDQKITTEGRMSLIRGMNAELGFARKPFPFGKSGLKIDAKTGQVSPDDQHLDAMMAGFGPAVKVGDRARITDIRLKDKSIVFDINGGAVKKKKWYEHIQVSGMGGTVQPGQPTDDTNLRGSFVELSFDKFVPELTPEQIKQLLDPVLNFHATSAAQAYLETIPPVAKQAISDHKVLVGMNREMVVYAKGRAPQKTREKDGDTEYEEWIYGVPPADVEFIRFIGDEVTQVKIMKVDGTKQVRTEKEVILKKDEPEVAAQQPGPPATGSEPGSQPQSQPQTTAAGTDPNVEQGPKGRPSLKRPGEDVDQPNPRIPKPQDRVPVGGPDSYPPPPGPT